MRVTDFIVCDSEWIGNFDGTFPFRRDGGEWEVDIPRVMSGARHIPEHSGRTAIALSGGEVVAHGELLHADVIEDDITVLVDSSQYLSPADQAVQEMR